MRFGHWRGVMFAVALFLSMAAGRMAQADGFHDTIPGEVLARDLATGQPYYAPPIPWGHYAKGSLFDHYGKTCVLGKLCLGKNCRFCGGKGAPGGPCGHGLFNHCGKGMGDGCGDPGCGGGHGRRVKDCGLCKGKGCGLCKSSVAGDPIHALASSQAPAPLVTAAPQASPVASAQCSDPGCKLGKGHDLCDGCGGKGCGKCGGLGRLFGKGCGFCGGKGCGNCGLGGLGGQMKGKIAGLFHHNKIKYFVGPGGPIPLTPGYTPYVVTTRSPRDFLAFPPYTPDGF
jgi:hypothetical protein